MMKPSEHIIILVEGLEMQFFLATVLKEALYAPVITECADEALEKIITLNPLLIIIDMMMPQQQGIKMYRQLRAHEKFRRLPVIMLSSLAKEAFFQYQNIEYTLPRQGLPKPEGYLPKPPEANELITTVRRIIKHQPGRKNKCL